MGQEPSRVFYAFRLFLYFRYLTYINIQKVPMSCTIMPIYQTFMGKPSQSLWHLWWGGGDVTVSIFSIFSILPIYLSSLMRRGGLWVCLVADFFDIFDFETPLQDGQYTIEIFKNLDSSSISRDRGGVRDGPGAFQGSIFSIIQH